MDSSRGVDNGGTKVHRERNDSNSQQIIRFRNYTPQTDFLDGMYTIEQSQPGSIRHLIEDKLNLIVSNEDDGKRYMIDPASMEPKKANWDLKRRLEKKMEKLDRETSKCIDKHLKSSRSQPR